MLLAYLDESYSRNHFYIAALVVPEAVALPLATALDDLVTEVANERFPGIGLTPEAELHGYELFHGVADWQPLNRMHRARVGIYADACSIIASHEVDIALRGMRTDMQRARYADQDDPHGVVLTFVLENVQEIAERDEALALVVADEVPGQSGHRSRLRWYQQRGTWGYRARPIDRIVDTIHFAPSTESRLIQAADLLAFIHHRREAVTSSDPRSAQAVEAIWQSLRPRFHSLRTWHP